MENDKKRSSKMFARKKKIIFLIFSPQFTCSHFRRFVLNITKRAGIENGK